MRQRRDTTAFIEFVATRSHALLHGSSGGVRRYEPCWRWRVRVPFAAALLIAATGCTSSGTADDAHGGPAASPSPSHTGTPSETPTPQDPVLSPRPGEVIELDQQGPEYVFTRAGRYAVRLSPHLVYEVDAPEMWEVLDGRSFSSSDFSGGNGIFLVTDAPAGNTWLPAHPCRDQTPVLVGPTVRDLAQALHAQPGLRATKPTAVPIGDRRTMHVMVPDRPAADTNSCVGGDAALFTPTPGDGWLTLWGGVEMWILEVDHRRWVIFANCGAAACTSADWATLNQMAESVTFARN